MTDAPALLHERVLERLQFAATHAVTAAALRDATVDVMRDIITDTLVARLCDEVDRLREVLRRVAEALDLESSDSPSADWLETQDALAAARALAGP